MLSFYYVTFTSLQLCDTCETYSRLNCLDWFVGAFVEWNTLAWILSTFPVLLMTSMLMMPESPTWLLSNGRDNQAKLALQMLRGYRTDIEPEWCQLRDNIRQSSRESTNKAAFWRRPTLTFTWNPTVWKPFTISLVIMILQQFSGINVVIYNTVPFFQILSRRKKNRKIQKIIFTTYPFLVCLQ